MLTATDVREMTDAQITERLGELREETFRLRFRSAMMQLEDPQLPRKLRHEVARMKTILRERELKAAKGEGVKK
ncbi:MAG: 50S ribosomal protein L29 [Gemmatimonadetes bacterium]|nr:50S ribosomal protein L29 [Gemmatimonadota bacterium]